MSDHWKIVNFDEIYKFTGQVNMYLKDELSDSDFTAHRLANGIYGQRQDGAYMVRIKLPGGMLNVDQLACIGELVDKYSDIDIANVTTRQDIQLHFVPMTDVPKVMLRLADVGLTTREACGNTVRNMTACPMAGQCEKEHSDIRPVLQETVAHFMRHPLTQYMPRKVKMSFSGCETDCAMGMIHDVGVVQQNRNGKIGFKVMAGGGLGHKPRKAIEVESFVSKEKLTAVIETIITMHNRYSDRKKRAKSRIKFLVDKFGEEGFIKKYQETLKEVSVKMENSESRKTEVIHFCNTSNKRPVNLSDEEVKQLEVKLKIGDASIKQIESIVNVMREFNITRLRTTQRQNLIINNVPSKDWINIRERLLSDGLENHEFDLYAKNEIVACPGDWTCRLGITSSRQLARQLSDGDVKMKIHISGCHNGCAQPQLADIGLHGEARRMFGKLIPFYRMYFGGDGRQSGELGLKGPEIPAARAEQSVKLVQVAYKSDHSEKEEFRSWARRKGVSFFSELLEEMLTVTADDLPYLLKDVGSDDEFRVLQLGGGECAGISEETVASQLAETMYEKQYRDIFVRQSDVSSAADCVENMLRLVGKSILFQQGDVVGKELSEILRKMTSSLSQYPAVAESFEQFITETEKLRNSEDVEAFSKFSSRLDEWIGSLLDKDNRITLTKYLSKERADENPQSLEAVLDLTDEICPMHYIKARQALRSVNAGQVLPILVKAGEDERLVGDSLKSVGFLISDSQAQGDGVNVLMSVKKPVEWTESIASSVDTPEVA